MAAALRRSVALLGPQLLRDPFLSRVVAAMFACGGLMMLVAMLLPRPASGDDLALWIITGGAFLVGAAVFTTARHIPRWLAFGLVAAFSALVCGTIYASGIGAGMYSTMLIWAALFSAYFFSPRAALAQLCWGLACYAVTLALVGTSAGFSAFTRWLLTAFALTVAVAVTTWLVARRKATEERADRFFRLSRDMLCTADEDGHFRELNPAWVRTLGWSDEELCARPFLEFVHPEDRERTLAETARLFSGADTVSFENRYRAKDGVWHWLDWSATYSPTQHLVYARATDVTKRKSLVRARGAGGDTAHAGAQGRPHRPAEPPLARGGAPA